MAYGKIKSKSKKEKTYIFQTTKSFSLDAKGKTPSEAFKNAKKDLGNFNKNNKNFGYAGELTGAYNTYGKDDTVPTGYFPKRLKRGVKN